MDLFDELTRDGLVGNVRVGLGCYAHGGVFEDGDVGTQVAD